MDDLKGNMEEVISIWREADAVCFDVDSTVIQEEGIDELAKFCGKGPEVQAMTKNAMGGGIGFREALTARLNIIQPTMTQIRDFIRFCPPRLTPGIKKLVDCLHQRSIPVYLVSGGFRGLIGPVALDLNIPLQNIYANKLKFFLNASRKGTPLLKGLFSSTVSSCLVHKGIPTGLHSDILYLSSTLLM
ncbi:phosphoserine phosphatase isoform X3 [Macrosteles quadrilineatus]|uniref:phosphoserine phosphatase isoform X3 n=1 Tax=Macrosteles quadrilineatus TaxID=74068 RepID=UPI0023E26560|nr:phosphoserine phosphatase isoform X3 [Macrosteles quadrilineatus]